MSILNKYNQGNGGQFEFEAPESFEFKNLKDVYAPDIENRFKVNAMYINTKSMYGNAPVIITDNEMLNIPQHLTETVETMILDEELVQEVNNGSVGIEIYEYTSKKWGKHYSVNFIEL